MFVSDVSCEILLEKLKQATFDVQYEYKKEKWIFIFFVNILLSMYIRPTRQFAKPW